MTGSGQHALCFFFLLPLSSRMEDPRTEKRRVFCRPSPHVGWTQILTTEMFSSCFGPSSTPVTDHILLSPSILQPPLRHSRGCKLRIPLGPPGEQEEGKRARFVMLGGEQMLRRWIGSCGKHNNKDATKLQDPIFLLMSLSLLGDTGSDLQQARSWRCRWVLSSCVCICTVRVSPPTETRRRGSNGNMFPEGKSGWEGGRTTVRRGEERWGRLSSKPNIKTLKYYFCPKKNP